MMASGQDDIGGLELCSHQDASGTKFDCNGNGNVGDDLGASYVFVNGVGDVDGCGLSVEENCHVKGDGGVGNDHDFAVGMDKDVDLHAEFAGEVSESAIDGEVDIEEMVEDRGEVETGEDLESRKGNGLDSGECEGTVEDRGELEVGEDLKFRVGNGLDIGECEGTVDNQRKFEPGEDLESWTGNGLDIEESEGMVIVVSNGDVELVDKGGKDVEENGVVLTLEVGESEQLDTIGLGDVECVLEKVEAEVGEEEVEERTELKSVEGDLVKNDESNFRQMKDLGIDEEIGESQEGLIILADTGEFDKSIKAVEQDLIVPPADFGEGSQFNTVPLGEDSCESAEIDVDVGEGILKDQTELNSEESLESDISTTKSVDCVSHDPGENQCKFEHATALGSEIDGGAQMGNKISAVVDKGIICTIAADDVIDLDKCVDGSQSVDKLDLTPSDAATPCFMDKVPTECGDNITSGTDDCAAVEHGAVNSKELHSSINQTCELIGHVPVKFFGGVLASIEDGTVSDEGRVDSDCGIGHVQGYDAEIVALDTNVTLTTETATKSVADQSKITEINLGEQRSGCINSPELNGNADDAHSDCIVPQVQSDKNFQSDCNGATILQQEVRSLVCPITDKSELETKLLHTEDVESGNFSVIDGTKSESEVANGLSSCAPNGVRSEIKIEFGTIDSAQVVSKSWVCNPLSKSQVLKGDIDCNQTQAIFTTNIVESEGCADMSSKSDVQNHSAIGRSDMHVKDATVAECSIGDNVDGRSLGNVAKAKPFQFLARFPRIDDDKLREQIREAQVLVEEKTVLRKSIRWEIDVKRTNLQSLGDELEATKSDEIAARRLVKQKRQEIDSVQDKINRAKNSIAVMDITNRIAHMEHMIEHETHPLKEEMQLLHEIKVMKKLRGQISSNVCSAEEVTQALSQLEPTEMQLKTLKKELGDLKNKAFKAEAAGKLLGKEYNDESKKLRELQAQFQAANDIRQDAYKDLLGLKRQLHEKGKHFWIYKDDAKAATDYALNGDKEALYHLCAKQVDTFMDLWNKNDEVREDYVRCNMKSTLRRFKTLDGRSLGPDEEVHVFPIYVGERESRQFNNASRTTSPSSPTITKQENTVQPVEREPIDGKSLVMTESKIKMLKGKTSGNPIPRSGLHIEFGQLGVEETNDEEKQQTKEELELARKDEILRKDEIDAELKEQLRQEEKVKAQEALERKKRNADKAQMRALSRAQKEAEQKEKEKEKRMRKKEKKTTDGENGPELQTNQIKEESKDSPAAKPIKTSHFNRYNKTKATIPPALRNRGKKRLKQFMWWIFGALIVLFIFLVGNSGAFKNLRPLKEDGFLGNQQPAQPIWKS
ncbi:uncharacterized protein LOC141707873 [Apium graveolens]|uniref:uncharacterized protein LOC141707873 n=1 Tax=Apium graveolens TaxID=4045 RepID=UPI003D7A572A